MLKGINKQVVEITRPDSTYFEKVIFFVKPEYASLSEDRIRSKAERFINDSERPPEKRKEKSRKAAFITFLKFALASLSGAFVGGTFMFISFL